MTYIYGGLMNSVLFLLFGFCSSVLFLLVIDKYIEAKERSEIKKNQAKLDSLGCMSSSTALLSLLKNQSIDFVSEGTVHIFRCQDIITSSDYWRYFSGTKADLEKLYEEGVLIKVMRRDAHSGLSGNFYKFTEQPKLRRIA